MKKIYTLRMKLSLLLLFVLLAVGTVGAEITIDSFRSTPETVQPGEDLELRLDLDNIGDDDIDDIVVSIDLSNVPFAPIESSTEKVIDTIRNGDEESVSFQLVALSSAEAQTYKIPVTITYENTTKTSLISLEVVTDASLDLLLESSDLVVEGEQGDVTIKIINEGLNQIKFLQITLLESSDYEILSPPSLYIGEIDTGDFETEEFTIIPTSQDPELSFKLEYRDANNKEFTEEKQITVKVYSTEQAAELGLVKQGNSMTWILILVVLALGIWVYIKRKKQKKNVR
ncbi:hypothetical protein EXS74_03940 [Candidatus Woesearchaeota archaeon]|nr:hypothetical protein [Candidatus Woesearchaeota archaeon]